jgi:hypothetical protein
MKNNIITIFPYIIGFALIWTVAFPLYSGGGLSLFQSNSILYLQSENAKISEALSAAENISKKAESEFRDYQNLPKESMDKISKTVPVNFDRARAFNDIYEIGRASGFDISTPVSVLLQKDNNNSGSALKSFNNYVFTFESESGYDSLKRFLSAIETNLTLYNIKGISIEKNKDPLKKTTVYNLTLEAYELKK